MFKFRFIILYLVALNSTAFAVTIKEHVYRITNGQKQILDVYYPEGWDAKQKRPVMILFHGGGWSGGSKTQFRKVCQYFAERGLVTMTADYFLTDRKAEFPKGVSRKRAGVLDAKSAIRWVRSKSEELGVDPDKLITGGCSAGGHISTLALMNETYNHEDDSNEDVSAAALVLFSPAFTLENAGNYSDVNVFGNLNTRLPPTMFLHGMNDGWKKASDALLVKLREQGTPVDYWVADDAGHVFCLKKDWLNDSLILIDNFLVSLNLLEGKSALKPSKTLRLIK